jgi:hypothetical protein
LTNAPRTGEEAPQPSDEEWVLRELGYDSAIGSIIPKSLSGMKEGVLAENFLDAYPDGSTHREGTRIEIDLLRHADPGSEEYARIRRHTSRYIKAIFGPPPTE